MARSHVIDTRVALLIQSVRFANIYKVASHHGSTTPPFAKKRANGTLPNLEEVAKCPNSRRRGAETEHSPRVDVGLIITFQMVSPARGIRFGTPSAFFGHV